MSRVTGAEQTAVGEPFSVRTYRQQQALMRLLAVGGEHPFQKRVRLILRLACEALGVDRVGYWEFFSDNARLRCEGLYVRSRECYEAADELNIESSPRLLDALHAGVPVIEPDVSQAHFTAEHFFRAQVGALMAIPINTRGELVGALFCEDGPQPRRWEIDEQNFAISIAQLLSLANKGRRLDHAEEALRDSQLRFRAIVEASPVPMIVVTMPEGVCIYGNAAAAEAVGLQREELPGKETKDFYWKPQERVPVVAELQRNGSVIGREMRFRRADGTFRWFNVSVQTIELSGEPVAVVGFVDVSEHKRLEHALRHMALHDGLTGLPNRALFHDMLRRELAHSRRTEGYQFAILFVDLDNFKEVNDHFGHAAGDKLLVKLSEHVKQCLRPKDLFARMGGDEFAVLLADVAGEEEVLAVADRVNRVLSESQNISGHELEISGSIGVVMDRPDFKTPDQVMRAADKAMYRAKEEGRNRYVVFDGQAIRPRRTGLHQVVLKKPN